MESNNLILGLITFINETSTFNYFFNNQRLYRIPAYQRGYAWGDKQLQDLWKDIKNIEGTEDHYTGVLTLVQSDLYSNDDEWLKGEFELYHIVDGQQRLTSCLILLKCLVNEALNPKRAMKNLGSKTLDLIKQSFFKYKLDGVGESFIFSYEKSDPSYEFFIKHIFDDLDSPTDEGKETSYTKNLLEAKDFFSKKLSFEADLNLIFKRLTNQFKFNEYLIENISPYVVFESMNNRGKDLSDLEKLKNRLMFLVTKLTSLHLGGRKALENDINVVWRIIYESIGKIIGYKENLDDTFLRDHWILFFGNYSRGESKVYSTFLFDEYFTLQNIYLEQGNPNKINESVIKKYITSLSNCIQKWIWLYNTGIILTERKSIKNNLESLSRIGIKASFRPLLTAALVKYSDDESAAKLINILEELSFKLFAISDRQSNTGDSKFYSLSYELITDDISRKRDLKSVVQEIRNHINWYYRFDLFKNQIDELFDNGKGEGFYRWSGLRYFLYEYNSWEMKQNRVNDHSLNVDWHRLSTDYETIEHIFPKSCTLTKEEYLATGKKANNHEFREKQYEKLWNKWAPFNSFQNDKLHLKCLNGSLGNLLPLSFSKNSSLQNDSFLEKIDQKNKGDEYNNKGYKYGNYSENLVSDVSIKNNDSWNPMQIFLRGMRMLDFLMEKLGEPNILTDKQKAEMLGIAFLVNNEVKND